MSLNSHISSSCLAGCLDVRGMERKIWGEQTAFLLFLSFDSQIFNQYENTLYGGKEIKKDEKTSWWSLWLFDNKRWQIVPVLSKILLQILKKAWKLVYGGIFACRIQNLIVLDKKKFFLLHTAPYLLHTS